MGRAGLSEVSIRAVAPGDLDAIRDIFTYYVENTVATFEEIPRSVREWGELAVWLHGLDLPFLVADSDGEIGGYAYAAPAAMALHEAFGFTIAGRLTAVGRKHGRWIDTLLMQRAL